MTDDPVTRAAQQHADRDLVEGGDGWDCTRFEIYARAFRQGAQWQQQQIDSVVNQHAHSTREIVMDDMRERRHGHNPSWVKVSEIQARVGPLTNSPTPSTGSTASTDNAESDQRGKS